MKNAGLFRPAFTALLLAALALPSRQAWADLSYDAVCASIPSSSSDPTLQQKYSYCQAAESAQTAASADDTLWKVWAGVAAVCAARCVYSLTDHVTNKYLCMGAQGAGALAEGAVTKQMAQAFMAALQGIGTTYLMSSMFNSNAPQASGQTPGQAAPPQKDIGACLGALTAFMQSNAKKQDLSGQEQSVQSNLASAVSVQSQSAAANSYSPQTAPTGTSTAQMSASKIGTSGIQNIQSQPQSLASASCGGSAFQCAIASDSNLPGYVGTPRFASDFKKVSGQSLSDYLSKLDSNASPSQAALAALGSGAPGSALTPDQAKKVATAFSAAEANAEDSPSMYASAGGGAPHGSQEDSSMSDFMNGLMNKLGGQKEEKKSGLSQDLAFGNRAPASIAEDRTISLFERISARYQFVGRRMLFGEAGGGK